MTYGYFNFITHQVKVIIQQNTQEGPTNHRFNFVFILVCVQFKETNESFTFTNSKHAVGLSGALLV